MSIFQSVDQLHIDHDPIALAANAALEHVGHAEHLADFAQTVRAGIAKPHHRGAANYAQIVDAGEAG